MQKRASQDVSALIHIANPVSAGVTLDNPAGGLIRLIETENYSVENDFDMGSLSMASLALAVSPESNRIYATTVLD